MSDINTTVVISNYNYGQYVGACIESCLAQTVPCKIIVVDDRSGDDSWSIIEEYAKKEANVTGVYLEQNSNGNARGKNVGICMCDTKYITCLDSDDMLVPWSIECRLKKIKGKHDFIHGWAKLVWTELSYKKSMKKFGDVLRGPVKYSKKVDKIKKEKSEVRWTWLIEASSVLARTKIYHKFGLYDEEMRWKIDREMWWRWLSHGAKRAVLSKYVSIYRNHDRQVTRNRSVKDPKKCTQELIRRKETRINIDRYNTLLMEHYDHEKFISQVVT